MFFQRYLLLSDVHGNIDGIKRVHRAWYTQKNKFDAIIISGDFPVTTPLSLVLTYMIKQHNLSRLGYSTKVYKEELRKRFVEHQINSIDAMMKYLEDFNLPIMFIPGNIETRESIQYLRKNYPSIIYLDDNYVRFHDKINIFGLGGSLDHHGIVCDHEFSESYFKNKCQKMTQNLQPLDPTDPLIFLFHEPPYFSLAKEDIDKMKRKAKKRGYSYEFTDKAGSKDFYNLITEFTPRLAINGHFHEYQGIIETEKTIIINPGALATYNYGILAIDLSKIKKFKMEFYKIRPSLFNFTNFLYQKRNFITNTTIMHG